MYPNNPRWVRSPSRIEAPKGEDSKRGARRTYRGVIMQNVIFWSKKLRIIAKFVSACFCLINFLYWEKNPRDWVRGCQKPYTFGAKASLN